MCGVALEGVGICVVAEGTMYSRSWLATVVVSLLRVVRLCPGCTAETAVVEEDLLKSCEGGFHYFESFDSVLVVLQRQRWSKTC
jgi:hypothetical protein